MKSLVLNPEAFSLWLSRLFPFKPVTPTTLTGALRREWNPERDGFCADRSRRKRPTRFLFIANAFPMPQSSKKKGKTKREDSAESSETFATMKDSTVVMQSLLSILEDEIGVSPLALFQKYPFINAVFDCVEDAIRAKHSLNGRQLHYDAIADSVSLKCVSDAAVSHRQQECGDSAESSALHRHGSMRPVMRKLHVEFAIPRFSTVVSGTHKEDTPVLLNVPSTHTSEYKAQIESGALPLPTGVFIVDNWLTVESETELLALIGSDSDNVEEEEVESDTAIDCAIVGEETEVKETERKALKTSDRWVEGSSRMQRRVKHYGYAFDYTTLSVSKQSAKTVPPIPSAFLRMCVNTNGTVKRPDTMSIFHAPAVGSTEHSGSSTAAVSSEVEVEATGTEVTEVKAEDSTIAVLKEMKAKCITEEKSELVAVKWFSKLKSVLAREQMDQCTVNEYLPGQGIRPHVDSTECFGTMILVLSLSSDIYMDLRCQRKSHLGVKHTVLLRRRSLLLLTGDSRYQWSHGIAQRRKDGAALRKRRLSLTMRKARFKEEQCTGENVLKIPEIEARNVHSVYEEIAGHFSSTRHSPWPQVLEFLRRSGCVERGGHKWLADVGCGNGKYLKRVAGDCVAVGLDMSENLLKIAAKRGFDSLVADALLLPMREATFDVVICVAVLHHISTEARRLALIGELLRVCKSGGAVLICAWAQEQGAANCKAKRFRFRKADVLVPWALDRKYDRSKKERLTTFERYCHVYVEGELRALVQAVAGDCVRVDACYWDKGNWCIEFTKLK